jgi:putative ATP-dependent endonuclease of the OLD family
MKISTLKIDNYRTLEKVHLDFPASYSAICGPNDSGKTNVVRAIRALIKEESILQIIGFNDDQELTLKEDYPKWKEAAPSDRQISLALALVIERDRDAGFFQFLTKQLSLESPAADLALSIVVSHGSDRSELEVVVSCSGKDYTGIEAQEVLKRLQSSRSILFHNSTQVDPMSPFRHRLGGIIRAESAEHEALVASMKKTVNRGIAKISKTHQKELEGLLGRLETKYSIGLSMPAFDFSSVPYNVTLGQKKFEVPLDDWGSGTKNRTLILMTLFRAKQLSESEASASKITPVIVIEEPESFLHPAAQAEFGRILHDLSEEFRVQVIVTTHSPYLLNIKTPAANLLLRRHVRYKQLQETERVDTSGENWMQPFSLALGLESEEFKPWKELLLANADAILLVEGELDKEYFGMLRDSSHGGNKLDFSGEVVSYDGTGSLQNTVLLRFIKNRYKRLFVTYDLDAEDQLAKPLQALGLEKKIHFAPVGLNEAGKRNIEGLLPESVTTSVYGANPSVVQAAANGTKKEQESARSSLKKLLFEEFKRRAVPGQEHFGKFYPLVKMINNALGSSIGC